MTDTTPMHLGTSSELELLKNAIIAGVLLGVVYDFFRVIRHTSRSRAVGFVCDLFYSLIFGAAFFVFSLSQTGYYRGFLFVGMLAGTVMWSATAGKALSLAAERITGILLGHLLFPVTRFLGKSVQNTIDRIVHIQPKSKIRKKIEKTS